MDREMAFVAAEFDRALDIWCLLGRHQDAARVRYVARLLRERGAWPDLVREWTAADQRGDDAAAWRMGWVLLDRGDRAGSERAFDRAAQWGNLATLNRRRGERARTGLDTTALDKRHEQALRRREEADRLADQRGDAEAAYRIGFGLIARADSCADSERARELRHTGEAALHRAVERGSAEAAAELGELAYREHPDFPESDAERGERALPWYRRADELGHPSSSWRLGGILEELGDEEGAEAAYQRAEARGHPRGPSRRAALLWAREPLDLDSLEVAYRQVTEIDYDPQGWVKLGNVLKARGNLDAAEAAYRQAIERGVRGLDRTLRLLRDVRGEPNSG